MEVGDAKAEPGRGLEAAGGCVHADGGRREGVVGREDEGAPVLAAFVGGLWRAGEDVVPSGRSKVSEGVGAGGKAETDSRMFVSEGWAMMYGGGFFWIIWYSRVSLMRSVKHLFAERTFSPV